MHKWIGLFLSIPESKQNLKEKEKFRVSEEITPSKLGFVMMMGEDKKQPEFSASSLLQGKDEGLRQEKKILFNKILLQQVFKVIRFL